MAQAPLLFRLPPTRAEWFLLSLLLAIAARCCCATRPEAEDEEQTPSKPDLSHHASVFLNISDATLAPKQPFALAELLSSEYATRAASSRSSEAGIDERPSSGKGPDVVHFSIVFRDFFGMDFKDGSYTADILINCGWEDKRAASIVKGEHLTLSQESASKQIWMPAMAITSRDIQGVEEISTSVSIKKSGAVHKVQRVIAHQKNRFSVDEYPFDSQTLVILVASSKYMADEVKLEPFPKGGASSDASRVMDDAFKGRGFELQSFTVDAFEETSGPLVKSRGRMELVVKRSPAKWRTSSLTSGLSMTFSSYMVFWLPFLAPFAMPRLALSIISFLALQSVSSSFTNALAGVPGTSWGDYYFQFWTVLSLWAVVANVFMEYISGVLKLVELATTTQSEMKVYFPIACILGSVLCSIYHVRWLGVYVAYVLIATWAVRLYMHVNQALLLGGQDSLSPVSHAKETLGLGTSAAAGPEVLASSEESRVPDEPPRAVVASAAEPKAAKTAEGN